MKRLRKQRVARTRKPVDDNKGMCPKATACTVPPAPGPHLFQHPQNAPTLADPPWCILCGRRVRLASDDEGVGHSRVTQGKP